MSALSLGLLIGVFVSPSLSSSHQLLWLRNLPVRLQTEIVLGTSRRGYELSWVRVVLGTSCLGYELSWVRVVFGTSCPRYELSWERVVHNPYGMRTPPILSILYGDQLNAFILLYVLYNIDLSTHLFMENRMDRTLWVLAELSIRRIKKDRHNLFGFTSTYSGIVNEIYGICLT